MLNFHRYLEFNHLVEELDEKYGMNEMRKIASSKPASSLTRKQGLDN